MAQLIKQRWGVCLERTTVGSYLRRWGLTPPKPATRARQPCPHTVQQWLGTQYPALHQRAYFEGAHIHWGDEMGLRSDHQAGTSWAPSGQTPVLEGTGKRFGGNLISTLTNRGTLRFQVFEGSFTTEVFLEFLRRLVRSSESKVFLIVNRHRVHRARRVQEWVAQHAQQLELFYLPPYSPERNPDEFLNQDVKTDISRVRGSLEPRVLTNALGRQQPHDTAELMQTVRADLHRIQRCPERVSRYFWAPSVKYAGL